MHTTRILFREKQAGRKVLDARTGEAPTIVPGDDFELQAAFENEDGSYLLSTEVGTLEFIVRDASEDETVPKLMTMPKGAADCDATFVKSDWATGDKQLVAVQWEASLTGLPISEGKEKKIYYLYAVHLDPSGNTTTYGAYVIHALRVPRATATVNSPDPVETVLTLEQADTRYIRAAELEAEESARVNGDAAERAYAADQLELHRQQTNPHGTTAGDVGAATQGEVTAIDARLVEAESSLAKVSGPSLAEAARLYANKDPEPSGSWRGVSIDSDAADYVTASGSTNVVVPNAMIRMLKGEDIGLPYQLTANYWDNFFAGWLLGATTNASGTTIYDLDQNTTPKELTAVGGPARDVLGMRFGSGKWLRDDAGSHLWSGALEQARLTVFTADTGSTGPQIFEGQYENGAPNGRIYTGLLQSGKATFFHGHTSGNANAGSVGGQMLPFLNTMLYVQTATEWRSYLNGQAVPIASGTRAPQTQAAIEYRIGASGSGDRNCFSQVHGVFLFTGSGSDIGGEYSQLHKNVLTIFESLSKEKLSPPTGRLVNYVEVDNTAATPNLYLGSNDLFRLPDGRLYYKGDEFGDAAHTDGTDLDRQRVYVSTDEGGSFTFQNNIDGLFWSKMVYEDAANGYFFGTSRRYGNLVFARSSDGLASVSITTLLAGDWYHTAPCRGVVKDGKLFVCYQRNDPSETPSVEYPIELAGFAWVDLSTDIMDAANWNFSSLLNADDYPEFQSAGQRGGMSEFHMVELPNGRLAAFGRWDGFNSNNEKNQMVRIDVNESGTDWDGIPKIVPFNGGYTKTDILTLDKGGYLIIHNRDRDLDADNDDRTTISLSYSPDMEEFVQLPDISGLNPTMPANYGAQYPIGLIEGDNLKIGLRVGDSGLDYHDSESAHFGEIENFGKYLEAGLTS